MRYRPQLGLGVVIPLAYVLPAWCLQPLFDVPADTIVGTGIDVKVAVGASCLILYCFLPRRTIPLKFVPADVAVLALMAVHLASELVNRGPLGLALGRIYVEWYLPFVAGRLAIQSRRDVAVLRPLVAGLAMALAAAALVEAFTNVNVFEIVFGARPVEGFDRDVRRWNMERAYGPTMHPIYFGVVQVLLLGWTSLAAFRAYRRQVSPWWILAWLPSVLGICATGSRGPILAIGVSLIVAVFFQVRRARWPLIGVLIASSLLVSTQWNSLVSSLESWANETKQADTKIAIGEEAVSQSGTRNRLNLLEVYRIAILRSGLLGYGTDAVTGFPINVPLGPHEAETIRQVKYIDNEYVLITLRFGYLGLVAFIAMGLASVGQFFYVANRYRGQTPQWLCTCLGATTVGVLVTLLTVWMPHEIGFPLMWTCGISSGLLVAHIKGDLGSGAHR